ncbi:outer membrane family protein [Helicobacter sp. 13S00477-4]|uniref:outer membrane family protein n=1 Tax=Helicobacter sp. 13S00477-4 TaxID=1905759 RepID=UPI000BA789BB|nr:outer membrane family protein [Helicobacter sp. 13S00477-4]PAF52770.1 hypothetical protein BKH44_00885 [Helicobacter sp. 13S00477-4]
MLKTQTKSLLLTGLFVSVSWGFDYNISGQVQNWSKFGFNNNKIDTINGKYPTDSFSVISASLGIELQLGAGFKAGLGGTVGGLVFDNTKFQHTTTGELYDPQGLAWNYFGFWPGPDYRSQISARTTRNYLFQNAFISYQYDKYIEAKIGRFSIPGDWLSGYIQGLWLQSSAIPHTKIWAFTTNKRASLGGKWLKDFKYMNQNIALDNGKGFYMYSLGADFKYKNFGIQAYVYAQDSRFIAPGLHLTYDTNPNFNLEGFRSKTEIIYLFMQHVGQALNKTTSYNNYDIFLYTGPQLAGKGGQSLMIRQSFDINNYSFGAIVYKNFGNPNEFLTPYGDPTGFDNYDNSVYDSTAWNNVFRRDSINGFIFASGKYTHWSWGFLGRITHSPRADEQAVSLNFDYKFPLNITAGIKLEYYNNTTFRGYTLGYTSHQPKPMPLQSNVTQDRSYVSTYISHNF